MNKILWKVFYLGCLSITSIHAEALTPEEINDYVIKSESPFVNAGVTIGTLGYGLNISKPINNYVSLRFNLNQGTYNTTDDSLYNSMLTSDRMLEGDTKGLLVDVYLWQLRVTAGAYINNNKMIYTAKPTERNQYFLNNIPYDMDSITQIKSTVTFNTLSPYMGVGWGNKTSSEGWSLSLDIGLMYHGNPDVAIDVTAKEGLSADAIKTIQSNAVSEQKTQEKDFSNYPFYPVIMIGANYSF